MEREYFRFFCYGYQKLVEPASFDLNRSNSFGYFSIQPRTKFPLLLNSSEVSLSNRSFQCPLHLENNCFDVVHARSVCSSWRSTFPFPSSLLRQSYSMPLFTHFPRESKELCTLEKIPLFLFIARAPVAANAEYILGLIGQDTSNDHMELPSPIQCSVKIKIPRSGPTLMNMLDYQILPLGHHYIIGCDLKDYRTVAFLPLNEEGGGGGEFVVLLLDGNNVWLVLRSAEMRWMQLKELSTASCKELFTFRGRFYVSYFNGDTFVIDPSSLEVTLITPDNNSNYLVPSGNDELFWVKVDYPTRSVSRLDEEADEEAGKWVEVTELGDRVLFIGGHLGNFCCAAKELPQCCGLTGNSILFTIGLRNEIFP